MKLVSVVGPTFNVPSKKNLSRPPLRLKLAFVFSTPLLEMSSLPAELTVMLLRLPEVGAVVVRIGSFGAPAPMITLSPDCGWTPHVQFPPSAQAELTLPFHVQTLALAVAAVKNIPTTRIAQARMILRLLISSPKSRWLLTGEAEEYKCTLRVFQGRVPVNKYCLCPRRM